MFINNYNQSDILLIKEYGMNRPLYQKKQTEMLTAYLFVSPAVLLISIFGLVPVFYALWVSLNKWRISRRGFIGLKKIRSLILLIKNYLNIKRF